MLLRRHPIVLVRLLALPMLLLTIWLVSFLLVEPFLRSLGVDPLVVGDAPPQWLQPLLWSFWFLVGALLLGWVVYALLDWREDWLALTTQRVIVMNKMLFLRESRREAPIGKVQNVVADYPNAIGMALDFGDIKIDTAGLGTLHFKSLPRPKAIREAIFRQQKEAQGVQPPPEDMRKTAVKAIVLGTPPDAVDPASSAGKRGTRTNKYGGHSAVRVWHKHWAFLVRGIALPIALWSAVLFAWLLSIWIGTPGAVGPIETALTWSLLLLMPICTAWIIWAWEDWRNDVYKIDHERLYHIESLPFGLRERSKETLINRITDVMYVIPGPLANLLDYGSVVIKTPGEATEFIFAGIPCPRQVQQELMERMDAARKDNVSADPEIKAWIKAYHEVVQGG